MMGYIYQVEGSEDGTIYLTTSLLRAFRAAQAYVENTETELSEVQKYFRENRYGYFEISAADSQIEASITQWANQ